MPAHRSSRLKMLSQPASVDAAIFPLRKLPKGILGFNPWYMDDDVAVNEEYFKEAKRLRNPSFDS